MAPSPDELRLFIEFHKFENLTRSFQGMSLAKLLHPEDTSPNPIIELLHTINKANAQTRSRSSSSSSKSSGTLYTVEPIPPSLSATAKNLSTPTEAIKMASGKTPALNPLGLEWEEGESSTRKEDVTSQMAKLTTSSSNPAHDCQNADSRPLRLHIDLEEIISPLKSQFEGKPRRNKLYLTKKQRRKFAKMEGLETVWISKPYPPCGKEIKDLEKTFLRKMKLGIRAENKYIIVRILADTDVEIESLRATIVEDEKGIRIPWVPGVAFHGAPEDCKFAKGALYILKQPMVVVGGVIDLKTHVADIHLTTDHITDVIWLSRFSQIVPAIWQDDMIHQERDTKGWVELGLQVYQESESNAADAAFCFKSALEISPDVERDNYINYYWGDTCLSLKEDEAALDHYRKVAGLPMNNRQNFERNMIMALIELDLFREACSALVKYRHAYPGNADPEGELTDDLLKIGIDHIKEKEKGVYNFLDVYEDTVRDTYTYHGTYTEPVTVKPSGLHGRGLFTTKAVKAGDLLMVERAFAHTFANLSSTPCEDATSISRLLESDRDGGIASTGTVAALIGACIRKMDKVPSTKLRFQELFAGSPDLTLQGGGIKGQAKTSSPINTFFVQHAVAYNAFESPRNSRLAYFNRKRPAPKSYVHSNGIWIIASAINHSCMSNARYSFIGDLFILRATRDIPADTELTISYIYPSSDEETPSAERFLKWGFICKCAICKEEKGAPKTIVKRKEMAAKITKKIANLPHDGNTGDLERMMLELEKTYLSQATRLPRILLAELRVKLLGIHQTQKNSTRLVNCALSGLADLGFIIEGGRIQKGKEVVTPVVKTWGITNTCTLAFFMFLGAGYDFARYEEPRDAVQVYNKIVYRVVMGEDDTFKDFHGNAAEACLLR